MRTWTSTRTRARFRCARPTSISTSAGRPLVFAVGLRALGAARSLERRHLGLQLLDTPLQRDHGPAYVVGVEHLRDVLGAVGVPGLDLEQDDLLRARGVALGPETGQQRGIALHHAGPAPQLHAPALGVIH